MRIFGNERGKRGKMNLRITYILFGLLISSILGNCEINGASFPPFNLKTNNALSIDSTISLLKNKSSIPIEKIRELNSIDPFYSHGSKGTVYCDTTVQLTTDLFYSILSLPDTLGVCSYYFLITVDEKKKKAIASQYLEPNCDIDFSSDSYQLYDHFVISRDSIMVRETTIYQKENKTSDDEEENIDHKAVENHYFFIKPTGEIVSIKNK